MDTKEIITMLGDKIEMNATEYRNMIEQDMEVRLEERLSDDTAVEVIIRKKQ